MVGTRGQSEVLGYALILGLTLLSVSALAAFGGSTLQTTENRIGAQSAENAVSQLDSKAATVALGPTGVQRVQLGQDQAGTYSVAPEAGWLRLTHENDTTTTELYNATLGAVRYRTDDTEIGYQAGGVWRRDAGSVMLSTPEFHYRGSTLTLPLITVDGEGSVAGRPVAVVKSPEPSTVVFPDPGREEPSTNPVQSGEVSVTVHSEYYDAWGRFFETRTAGSVSVDDDNRTATVELVSPPTRGDFAMPLDGNAMTLKGILGHSVDSFQLTLFDDEDDSANFNNLQWSLYAESGTQEFEVRVTPDSGTEHGDAAELVVYYSPNGSSYQSWETTDFTFEEESVANEDWNDDGDEDDKRLVLNLSGNATVTYGDYFQQSNAGFNPDTFTDNATFEGHSDVEEPRYFTDGETADIGYVINHYLALMGPAVDLTVADKQSDTVSERLSTGYLAYNSSEGYYLTYMHVSENPVNVTVGTG
jgi:hypothetical protein